MRDSNTQADRTRTPDRAAAFSQQSAKSIAEPSMPSNRPHMDPKPVMHNRTLHHGSLALFSLLLLSLAGCATPPPKNTILHLQVTEFGSINWSGQTFAADQLPAHLASAHVNKAQNIRILVPDNQDKRQMAQIYNILHNSGYLHVLFQEKPRATAEVVGEPASRSEVLVPKEIAPAARTP